MTQPQSEKLPHIKGVIENTTELRKAIKKMDEANNFEEYSMAVNKASFQTLLIILDVLEDIVELLNERPHGND